MKAISQNILCRKLLEFPACSVEERKWLTGRDAGLEVLKGRYYSSDGFREGRWRNGPGEDISDGGVKKATQWNAGVQIRRAQVVWEQGCQRDLKAIRPDWRSPYSC